MISVKKSSRLAALVICAFLSTDVFFSTLTVFAASPRNEQQWQPVEQVSPFTKFSEAPLSVTGIYTVLLPIIQKPEKITATLSVDFGPVFIKDHEVLTHDLPLAKEMGASWIRVWVSWAEIETAPGVYDWTTLDATIARLKEVELKPLPVIYYAPAWAAEEGCGPLSDTMALESFLDALIGRYGADVEAWEFINEPDAREPFVPFGPVIGCWGLAPEKYAAQLGIFHEKVKELDPEAFVLFGGLAYDNWEVFERSFFDKALKNGAGDFFDVLSLHYYPINPVEFPTMADKINELQETMTNNGVTAKRIWITETSMWVNGDRGLEAQLDFIAEELTRGYCAGADNMFWFAVRQEPFDPALHRWLISRDHQPDNGYYTFQNYAQKVEGASCLGSYENVPTGVEAYQFETTDGWLYILWSNTTPQMITIPTSSTEATLTDRDGNSSTIVPAQNGQVTFDVGTQAVFLEITQ